MTGNAFDIQQAISAFPEKREELARYAEKATKLKNECGCALGATFFLVAVLALVFGLVDSPAGLTGLLTRLSLGALLTMLATLVGKATGIAIARLRLAWLNHWLRRNYSTGEK